MVTSNIKMGSMIVLMLISFVSAAQQQEKIPYYISLNNSIGTTVHEVINNQLYLQYNDSYGKGKDFSLKIYDFKGALVSSIVMDKVFGMNHYAIDLDKLNAKWESKQVYICRVRDERGKIYELPIKLVPAPDKKDPEVSIIVNPIEIQCNELNSSLVEFYADIKGGKAPYTLNWFVLNRTKTDFLYQPKEELISEEGKISFIQVDKNPEYYVVLFVKDACGNVQKKIVNLLCENDEKKINTLFIEELNSPLFKGKNAIN